MEGFIIVVFGIGIGIFVPLFWQIILVCITVVGIFFLEHSRSIDGIGSMILIGIAMLLGVGLLIGNGVNYINNNYISVNNKVNIVSTNLPTLLCKSGVDNYILTEYTQENQNIINVKTGQIFIKENCSLK